MTCSTSLVHYKFLKSEIKVASTLATEEILSSNTVPVPLLSPAPPPLRKLKFNNIKNNKINNSSNSSSITLSPASEQSTSSPQDTSSITEIKSNVIIAQTSPDIILESINGENVKSLSSRVCDQSLPFMIDRRNNLCNSVNGCREELHISDESTCHNNMNNNLRRLSNGQKEHHHHHPEEQQTLFPQHSQPSSLIGLKDTQVEHSQEQCATDRTPCTVNSSLPTDDCNLSSRSSVSLTTPTSGLQSSATVDRDLPLLSSFLKPEINEKTIIFESSLTGQEDCISDSRDIIRKLSNENNELNGDNKITESYCKLATQWTTTINNEKRHENDNIHDKKLPQKTDDIFADVTHNASNSLENVDRKKKDGSSIDDDDVPRLISTESAVEHEEPRTIEIARNDSTRENDQELLESNVTGSYDETFQPKEQSDKNERNSKSSQSTFGLLIRSGVEYEQDCLSTKTRRTLQRLNRLSLKLKQQLIRNQLNLFSKTTTFDDNPDSDIRLHQKSSASLSTHSFQSLEKKIKDHPHHYFHLNSSYSSTPKAFNRLTGKQKLEEQRLTEQRIAEDNVAEQKTLSTLKCLRSNLRHLQKSYDSDATESDDSENDLDFSIQNSDVCGSTRKEVKALEKRNTLLEQELNSCKTNINWLNVMCKETEMKHQKSDFLRKFCRNTRGGIMFSGGDPVTHRIVPEFISRQNQYLNSDEEIEDVIIENSKKRKEQQKSTEIPAALPITETSENLISVSPKPEVIEKTDTTAIISEGTIISAGAIISEGATIPETIPETAISEDIVDEGETCMRTIPYRGMKRRRVVNVEATLSLLKKVTLSGQYSDRPPITCMCSALDRGLSSCLLCRGENNFIGHIETEQMSYEERLKLMRPSYHSVISLPNSLPAGFYFAEMLASNEFKTRIHTVRIQIKKKKSQTSQHSTALSVGALTDKPPKKYLPSGTPQRPKKDKKDKIKSNSISTSNNAPAISTELKKRPRLSYDSRLESPPPSPAPSETSSLEPSVPSTTHKRRRSDAQQAYDINNIVIPSHMTSASKIEKLQYKEIITPAWTQHEDFIIPLNEDVEIKPALPAIEEEEEEDISDEALLKSHAQAENTERARILSFFPGNNKLKKSGNQKIRFDNKDDDSL